MYRLRAIVQATAEELATWPYLRLVGCHLGRTHRDVVAWLTYEVPPSAAGWITQQHVEQRAYSWVEGPADLRSYEDIRVTHQLPALGEVFRGAEPAYSV